MSLFVEVWILRLYNGDMRIVFIFLIFFTFSANVFGFTLSRNLNLGDVGPDVKSLQVFLNQDPGTAVATAGPGSLGSETEYFGNATRNAVIRFQKKYENEILIPSGLTIPTGFVGPATRVFINNASANKSVSPKDEEPLQEPAGEVEGFFSKFFVRPLRLYGLSAYQAKPGQEVVVAGEGFLPKENTVHIGTRTITDVKGANGTRIVFTVPSDLEDGKYNLWVSNKNGTTYNVSFGEYFLVSKNPKEAVTIVKLSPESIPYQALKDTAIVVTLSTKPAAGNVQIKTSLGDVKKFSINGETISFNLNDASDFVNLSRSALYLKNVRFPVYVYVSTDSVWSSPSVASVEF